MGAKDERKEPLLKGGQHDEIIEETHAQSLWKIVSFATNICLALSFQVLPNTVNFHFVSSYSDDEAILQGISVMYMFSGILGLSIAVGFGAAMQTYASQAYGAKNYKHVGLYLQKTTILVTVVVVFCLIIFQWTEEILLAIGLSKTVAEYSQRYIDVGQFGFPIRIATIIYELFLGSQEISRPQMWSSAISFLFYPLIAWTFLSHYEMGVEGCAHSMNIFSLLQGLLLALIVKVGKFNDERTWGGWSREAFDDLGSYTRMSLKTLVLRSVDWWAIELTTLQVGVMANTENSPELLAAYPILINSFAIIFLLAIGFSAASTAFVGNTLGEGQPKLAQRYYKMTFGVHYSILFLFIVVINLFADSFASFLTGDVEVQNAYVANLIFICISIPCDSLQVLFNGVLVGLGSVGAPGALSAFLNLFVGQFLTFCLWYWAHLKLAGVFLGMSAGLLLTGIAYAYFVCKSDFALISEEVRRREVETEKQ